MIGEAIRARGMVAAVAGRTGGVAAANCKLELLLKQHKLAIKVGNQLLIAHCKHVLSIVLSRRTKNKEWCFLCKWRQHI